MVSLYPPATLGAVFNPHTTAASQIDATLVGGGAVSNSEFGYLDGITSNIQVQLNTKGSVLSATNRLDALFVGDGNVSNTELGCLDGSNSNIKTQFDNMNAMVISTAGNTSVLATRSVLPEFVSLTTDSGVIGLFLSSTPINGLSTTIYNNSSTTNHTLTNGSALLIFKEFINPGAAAALAKNVAPRTTHRLWSQGGVWWWMQVQHTLTATNRLDAQLVGTGLVTNLEFSYLDGVTSNIQTQIGNISPLGVSVSASSDYSSNVALPAYLACYPGGGTIEITLSATPPNGLRTTIHNCSSAGVVTIMTSGFTPIFGMVDDVTHRTSSQDIGPANTILLISTNGLWLWSQVPTFANIDTHMLYMQAEIDTKQDAIGPTARLDASFVGGGTVSNTELGYLDGTTSNIQAQIASLNTTTNGIAILNGEFLSYGPDDAIPRTLLAQYNGASAHTTLILSDVPTSGVGFSVNCRWGYKRVRLVVTAGALSQFYNIKTNTPSDEFFVEPGTRVEVFASQSVWWYTAFLL